MRDPGATEYARLNVRGGYLLATPDLAGWAQEQVQSHGTLEACAQAQAGCREISGRGTAYLITLPNGQTGLVRRLRHGGLFAFATTDRFLRVGASRPENELRVSLHLSGHGIETPRVLVACVYPRGCYYQGEMLRAYLEEANDLAAFVFESGTSDALGREVLRQAMHLASRLAAVGVCHTDYHARNLLVQQHGDLTRLQVIDLEKSTACPPGSDRATLRMRRRLAHSLAKFSLRYGRTMPSLEELSR